MKLIYAGTSTQYEVELTAIKSNVIQVIGSLPMKEKGFKIIDNEGNEYDYSAFKTLYKNVEGGYQYSNDGEVWTEPTKEVIVSIQWDDDGNMEGLRPNSVTVTVVDNDTVIEKLKLSETNSWSKTYEGVPESHQYLLKVPSVDDYTYTIQDTLVTYSLEKAKEPTVEEMLKELTNMVLDLDERVHKLEGGK